MHRIMIVDDDVFSSLQLEELLKSIGYDVVGTAASGKAAIETARNIRPDLVLMDISLPVMDGYEATRAIRKTFPNLPVIGLSAHAMQGDVEKSLAAGCTDYLTKPLNEDLLFEKLAKYLG